MSIGTRIKELRTQKRLKQTELGAIVGLNYVQLGRYELGKAKPASDMLFKLAKALDTTTDYLVNDGENDAAVTAQLTDRELLKQFKEVELDILDYVDPGNSENLNFRKALYSS